MAALTHYLDRSGDAKAAEVLPPPTKNKRTKNKRFRGLGATLYVNHDDNRASSVLVAFRGQVLARFEVVKTQGNRVRVRTLCPNDFSVIRGVNYHNTVDADCVRQVLPDDLGVKMSRDSLSLHGRLLPMSLDYFSTVETVQIPVLLAEGFGRLEQWKKRSAFLRSMVADDGLRGDASVFDDAVEEITDPFFAVSCFNCSVAFFAGLYRTDKDLVLETFRDREILFGDRIDTLSRILQAGASF